jgi:hypothetical protein
VAPERSDDTQLGSRVRMGAATAVLVALGGFAAAAPARAGTGGAVFTPEPKLARIACVKECGPKGRIQGGSAVRITGSNLAGVTKIVFKGARSTADDKAVTVKAAGNGAITAPVPIQAQSGPVEAWTGESGVHSDPSRPIRILPPPPPESHADLSPAPGPADAGAPPLETATSASRWFYGAQRGVVFSLRLGGDHPAAVDVNLIRVSDGSMVQTWNLQNVAPGEVRTVSWNGVTAGVLQPEDRYAFRAVVHDGAVTARNASADDPNRDAFDFRQHFFPVRGHHDFGEAGARFGAARSGHTHQGQDVMAACGTRLVAAQGGIVKHTAFHSAAGYYIVIRGLDGIDNAYMHLAGPTPFREGDKVFTGQQIGVVGDTGDASACHLHFEIWTKPGWYDGGKPIDPLPSLQAWDAFS